MKKYFLALAILWSIFSNAQTGTTTAGQFKMTAPQVGTDNDSIVVWSGTDKRLKYVTKSSLDFVKKVNNSPAGSSGNVEVNLPSVLRLADRYVDIQMNGVDPFPVGSTFNSDNDSKIKVHAFTNSNILGDCNFIISDNDLPTDGMVYIISNNSSHKILVDALDDELFLGGIIESGNIVVPSNSVAYFKWFGYGFSPTHAHTFSVTYQFGSASASGSQDLNDTTLNGNFTEQNIEFQGGAGLDFKSGSFTLNVANNVLSANRNQSFPNASGTLALSVNGQTANSSGNISLSIPSGTITSVTATSPLTGGTITSTGSIGIQDAAADNSTKGASTYFPQDFNSSAGAISIDYVNTQKASASQPGALSSSDWSLFNGKQNAISLTTTGTGAATFVGNTLNIPTPDLSSINTILDGLRTPIATDQGNRTHTGTIAETIVASLRIPANTLNSVCNLFINYDFQKSTGVLIPIKVYRNSTNAIGGSPIALYNTGSNRNVTFSRKFLVRNTTLDLLSTSTASLVTNMNNDNSFVSSETTSIDRTVDNWIVITATLDNTASNVVTKSMTIEKQKL